MEENEAFCTTPACACARGATKGHGGEVTEAPAWYLGGEARGRKECWCPSWRDDRRVDPAEGWVEWGSRGIRDCDEDRVVTLPDLRGRSPRDPAGGGAGVE